MKPTLKIYRMTVPVTSMEKAVAFYQQILAIKGKSVSPTRYYFNCGGTVLVCWDYKTEGPEPPVGWKPYQFQYVYFAVNNLEERYDWVRKAGGDLRGQQIQTMPWGERLFYATDPFGNAICFVDEKTTFIVG
jgi:predicted enzyme related to lactoylglutathione lyase